MTLAQELTPMKATYLDIYNQLRRKMKWTDKKIVMMVASVYVTSDREFDIDRYVNLSETIKKEASMFSYLNSPLRYSVAAMLDTRFNDPFRAFSDMMQVYDTMIRSGFNRSQYTYLAAAAILQNHPEADLAEKVERAVSIHRLMKKEHPFLTSNDDYPLAALLAQREEEMETLIDQVEYIYRALDQNGFWKGNHLQFLSHMLSLDEEHFPDELVDRTIRASEALKRSEIRFKKLLYPEAGLLAFLGDEINALNEVLAFKDALDQEAPFRWQKEMNVKVAVNILVSHQLQEATTIQTGLFSTLETMMQAQQAATLAGITATTAASSSNSGGQ
ncbi:hypothetical protein GCM10007216_05710 [Thalassobacillus devorans]|uniref:DUF4003 domain-containing protein n=1 Tax=Thalassobacillus devorans TaxID=279813 RepID=A0ABQ1NIF1_9BACI|nr:DUF4003 family protein [Thalassobacillus devorans]NIK27479.1 hypothetical protein [Thalassobacillus devorans]GGC78029.1 hypothetical protein GCM10007216_05710 [Thalassobacillus devorans]